MTLSPRRTVWLICAVSFFITITLFTLSNKNVYAAQVTNRSLTLGSSAGNTATTWTFQFNAPGTTALNGISFRVCTTASGTCSTPGSWSNSGATFTSLTYNGSSQSGWTLDNTGAGGAQYLGIKNNSSSTATANPIVASFSSVTNPNTTNTAFYVRIATFTGDDFTTQLDTGSVAASTATQITLTGTMPESLIFCTGATVSTTGGIPDCTTASAGSVSFNDLFSPTATRYATSQMAASTNANFGYVISVNGATLTSGANTIPAITTGGGAASTVGTRQFGLNLKDNATPDIGTEVAPAANGTNYKGQSTGDYDTADLFKFVTGETVASSDNGGAGPTDSQIFTVAYIVNVSGSQAAGTYTSTLTYICTPTF